jgi:hypothetical protein
MKNNNERPRLWLLVLAASAMAVIGGGVALADFVVGAGEPVVISDDVFDRTTQVVSLAGPAGGDTSPAGSPAGDDGSGTDNNGHGNNVDGVDSSNPGQGGGGPNGGTDESCDGTGECVDDEATSGGSKGKKK